MKAVLVILALVVLGYASHWSGDASFRARRASVPATRRLRFMADRMFNSMRRLRSYINDARSRGVRWSRLSNLRRRALQLRRRGGFFLRASRCRSRRCKRFFSSRMYGRRRSTRRRRLSFPSRRRQLASRRLRLRMLRRQRRQRRLSQHPLLRSSAESAAHRRLLRSFFDTHRRLNKGRNNKKRSSVRSQGRRIRRHMRRLIRLSQTLLGRIGKLNRRGRAARSGARLESRIRRMHNKVLRLARRARRWAQQYSSEKKNKNATTTTAAAGVTTKATTATTKAPGQRRCRFRDYKCLADMRKLRRQLKKAGKK